MISPSVFGLQRQRSAGELATLLPPNPALARWMPQLAARTGPAAPDSDRIRLFGEILTLLEQLALTQPVVLLLEDMHWADDSSRELFAFLVVNLAHNQVLLVGTYRPAEAGPLRGLIAELRRNPGVRGCFAAAADPARGRPAAGGRSAANPSRA